MICSWEPTRRRSTAAWTRRRDVAPHWLSCSAYTVPCCFENVAERTMAIDAGSWRQEPKLVRSHKKAPGRSR